MTDRPLVTIGIPVFNAARWLRQSIQSALEQDWTPKEVLVVDDGSTDESPEIIRSFGDAIRAVFLPHAGQNPTRNAIIARMRGEWLQFLDADDYLLPGKISTQFAEAGDLHGVDFLASPAWWEDYADDCRRRLVPAPGHENLSPCQQILGYQIPQQAALLWRKTALDRLGGCDENVKRNTDWELYLHALRRGLRKKFTPTPGVVYRLRWGGQQVSMGSQAPQLRSNLELFLKMAAWMQERGEWNARHARDCAPACFQMLRALAGSDLWAALPLHRRLARWDLWPRRDLRHLHCAPARYALAYRWCGFAIAELLARVIKSRRP